MESKETVSRFEHENSLMHYGRVNMRSMIMLIVVCVSFVAVSLIYSSSIKYCVKYMTDALERIYTTAITEVETDGVHQQPNP